MTLGRDHADDARKTGVDARHLLGAEEGQSTVEAAFALPVLLTLFLLMMQPAIVLYDRMVMSSAAFEACRLMATLPSSQEEYCEDFVRRRLGAVPQQECFHVHGGDACSWEIEIEGDESSEWVTVTIGNKIRPLPLLGAGAHALNLVDDAGCLSVEVRASMPTQPSWVLTSAEGASPASWVGDWVS